MKNLAIGVSGVGAHDFDTLIVNCMPDLGCLQSGQWFPRWVYDSNDETQRDLFGYDTEVAPGLSRRDNISDTALSHFRRIYGRPEITKDEIFWATYGLLHHRGYRARWRNNLLRELPRLPLVDDFRALAEIGESLAWLHLEYEGEEIPVYPLETVGDAPFALGTSPMTWTDDDWIRVTADLKIGPVPPRGRAYTVGGRSPVEWAMRYYFRSRDPDSGIVNDATVLFPGGRADLARTLGRLVTVSLMTMDLLDALDAIGVAE